MRLAASLTIALCMCFGCDRPTNAFTWVDDALSGVLTREGVEHLATRACRERAAVVVRDGNAETFQPGDAAYGEAVRAALEPFVGLESRNFTRNASFGGSREIEVLYGGITGTRRVTVELVSEGGRFRVVRLTEGPQFGP